MSFAHLHVHTEYSLLDGFSNIKKLIARGKEMGMTSMAITDHGTMFGVIEFFSAAKEAGIKPILGLETYVSARGMNDRDAQKDKHSYHLVLLAKNKKGYKNLCRLVSISHIRPDRAAAPPYVEIKDIREHCEGLICLSGCRHGELASLLAK